MTAASGPRPTLLQATSAAKLALVAVISIGYGAEVLFQPGVFDFPARAVLLALASNASEGLLAGLLMLLATEAVERRAARINWLYSLQLLAATTIGASVGVALWALVGGPSISAESAPFLAGEVLRLSALGAFLAITHGLSRRLQEAEARERDLALQAAALRADTDLAQQRLLEAQIEPHFLFNTIANLRRTWRVDPPLGARMHDNVTRYLEAALPRMRDPMATLRDEIDLTRAYLELFALRMGPRLSFDIDVARTLDGLCFPRLSLLTLVENAIKHGIAPSAEGGRITIDAAVEPGAVTLRVADDGVGFGAADTAGTGVGLPNIRSRLLTRYGRDARLDIEAREAGGVLASIRIPLEAGTSMVAT